MASTSSPRKRKSKGGGKQGKTPKFTAATSDRHTLYQLSVQNVETEIDFVDETFKELRGRNAVTLREDFAGTANTSCEWVRRREGNIAVAVDLDAPTLEWGKQNNLTRLDDEQLGRITMIEGDVLERHEPGEGVDVALAMNFSYWIFDTREKLRTYFKRVLDSLDDSGVFFLDFYGGYEAYSEQEEDRHIDAGFTYVWDQHSYNPITGKMQCYIHFKFKDGSKIQRAFSYEWRLWSLPELRELLEEAGFARSTVYCEGTDEDGDGDGEFEPSERCDADAAFICYIVAEKK